MSHGIYLSAKNDAEGFRLPINPEKVDVSASGDGEEYTIAKLGKVNIPKDVELEEYSLESFFPLEPSHYSLTEHKKPQYYIDTLNRWRKEKLAIRYIYVNGSFAINELVTIENFNYNESDGSGDVYFNISLKKYVSFAPKKMIVVKKKPSKTVAKKNTKPRQNTKPKPKVYALVKGDSLWKVAQKFLGRGNRYPEIAKLNGIKSSDYRRLPIGLKVKLPPK